MTFKNLVVIFKNISNYEELMFLLSVIKRNDLDLVNKHSGLVNAYDFDALTFDECLALKLYSGISRRMKYKNLSKNFELRNPNNKERLDIDYIKIPNTIKI